MEIGRQAELSFITYLREDWLIREGVYANRSSIILTQDSENNLKYKNDSYFNWIYYVPPDISGVNYPPTIYDGGTPVDSNDYSVNYIRGDIIFDNSPTGVITADFAHLFHTTAAAFESHFDLLDTPLSYIMVDDVMKRRSGFQLGDDDSYVELDFLLQAGEYTRQAFTSRARVKDLSDKIARCLPGIPIIDFPPFPLTFSGSRVGSYNRVTQEIGKYTYIEDSETDFQIVIATDPRELARRQIQFTLAVVE